MALPQQQAVAKIGKRSLPVNHWYHRKESSNENNAGLLMEKNLQVNLIWHGAKKKKKKKDLMHWTMKISVFAIANEMLWNLKQTIQL